jgi:hypothetical protein
MFRFPAFKRCEREKYREKNGFRTSGNLLCGASGKSFGGSTAQDFGSIRNLDRLAW